MERDGLAILVGAKVVIYTNTMWNAYNFRGGIISSLVAAGCDVTVVAPEDRYKQNLIELGCHVCKIQLASGGMNPLADLTTLIRSIFLFRKIRPSALLLFTAKPNIYGSLAARLLGIPTINNITGLGSGFIKGGFTRRLLTTLYRLSLRRSDLIFFQNEDDRSFFTSARILKNQSNLVIPGSGVDLAKFEYSIPVERKHLTFLMCSRVIEDKGIREFISAARKLKKIGRQDKFILCGGLTAKTRRSISRDEVLTWVEEGVIEFIEDSKNIAGLMQSSDCVVLPSYREGTPRVLLEAAAVGRPIVTTDVPGCRDVVEHEFNGFLCRAKDVDSLSDRLNMICQLGHARRIQMGLNGRRKVEEAYDQNIVVYRYQNAIQQILRASEDSE